MIQPGQEVFAGLAERYSIIPIFKTVPADLETPVSIYLKTAGQKKNSFLLESGDLGEQARYSFIGCDPFVALVTEGSETIVSYTGGNRWRQQKDPINVLQEIIEKEKIYFPPELETFWGGAVGYVSYELAGIWEDVPGLHRDSGLPSCYFVFPGKVFIYDHRKHLLTAVVLLRITETGQEEIDQMYQEASANLEKELKTLSTTGIYEPGNSSVASANEGRPALESPGAYFTGDSAFPREEFMKAVVKAKEYINAGEIFQVVLSRRIIEEITCQPFSLYRALRSLNPSPYQFFLDLDGFQVIGASPEMLVKVENGLVYTKPIAGTRPRGSNEENDLHLASELSQDEKERAEHMMLVDLGRNDLGKVSAYGSVEVTKLLEVEYFSHVMHLVSEVRGSILAKHGYGDALKATFPAGTVSGAPKVRAMEIVNELEPVPRGPYSGAVGYVSFNGKMDTCITIRTLVTSGGYASIQAGSGIVADSDPLKEYEETEHKMAGSLRAIRIAEEREHDFNH